MNYNGLIDFNKYTLALAAGCFIYSLEKFLPMQTDAGRYLLLFLLTVFLLSAIFGVFLFAAATAALHANDERNQRINRYISWLGPAHAGSLCIGMIILGFMLFQRVMTPIPEVPKSNCCCQQELSPNKTVNDRPAKNARLDAHKAAPITLALGLR